MANDSTTPSGRSSHDAESFVNVPRPGPDEVENQQANAVRAQRRIIMRLKRVKGSAHVSGQFRGHNVSLHQRQPVQHPPVVPAERAPAPAPMGPAQESASPERLAADVDAMQIARGRRRGPQPRAGVRESLFLPAETAALAEAAPELAPPDEEGPMPMDTDGPRFSAPEDSEPLAIEEAAPSDVVARLLESRPAGLEDQFRGWARVWRTRSNHAATDDLAPRLRDIIRCAPAVPRDAWASVQAAERAVADCEADMERMMRVGDAEDRAEAKGALRQARTVAELARAVVDANALIHAPAAPRAQPAQWDSSHRPEQLFFDALWPVQVQKKTKPRIPDPPSAAVLARRRLTFVGEVAEQSWEVQAHAVALMPKLRELPIQMGPDCDTSLRNQRLVANEDRVVTFFVPEVMVRAKKLVAVLKGNSVKVRAILGHPTKHGDFLIGVFRTVEGVELLSAIIVEFKCPRGVPKVRRDNNFAPQAAGEDEATYTMRRAEMPARFGNGIVRGQLHDYMVGAVTSNNKPPEGLLANINPNVALLTDFNHLWEVRRLPDGDFQDHNDGDEHWGLSKCFRPGDDNPHISAVVANTICRVADDMAAHPASYTQRPPYMPLLPSVAQPNDEHDGQDGSSGQGGNGGHSEHEEQDYGSGRARHAGNNTSGDGPASRTHSRTRGGGEHQEALPPADSSSSNTNNERTLTYAAGLRAARAATADVVLRGGCPLGLGRMSGVHRGMAAADPEWARRGWRPLTGSCIIGDLIGTGRSGVVCRGLYNGLPAAFKCCEAEDGELAEELSNEVHAYGRLEDIQGTGVPRLFGHGLLVAEGTPYAVLVMELVVDRIHQAAGEDRGRAILRQCPQLVRKAAMAVLDAIHRRGACHGDARAHNILFEDDPDREGTLRPRVIDFSLGKVDPGDRDIGSDRQHWGSVLGLDNAHN